MKTNTKFAIAVIVVMFLMLGHPISQMFTSKNHSKSRKYPIYRATVPFGIFALDGEVSGNILFFKGSISETEKYFVKYMVGDEVRSISFDSKDVPIVVDGEFYLETILLYQSYKIYWIWNTTNGPFLEGYRIHIPYLPKINQTFTEDWDID